MTIIASLIKSLTISSRLLNLSKRQLNRIPAKELILELETIDPRVTELDLSENNLISFMTSDIVKILETPPETVTSFNLKNNLLFQLDDSAKRFKDIFASFLSRRTFVDISGNGFSAQFFTPLKEVITSVTPKPGLTICFGECKLESREKSQLKDMLHEKGIFSDEDVLLETQKELKTKIPAPLISMVRAYLD